MVVFKKESEMKRGKRDSSSIFRIFVYLILVAGLVVFAVLYTVKTEQHKKKISSFEIKTNNKDIRIIELKKTLEEALKTNKNNEDKLTSIINDYEKKIKNMESRNAELAKNEKAYKSRTGDLESKYRQEKTWRTDADRQKALWKEKADKAQMENTKLKGQLTQITKERDDYKSKCVKLQKTVDDFKSIKVKE
jgi:chromosome segregation ATPase